MKYILLTKKFKTEDYLNYRFQHREKYKPKIVVDYYFLHAGGEDILFPREDGLRPIVDFGEYTS